MKVGTAFLLINILELLHIEMSSGWERVRLRVETKQNLETVNMEEDVGGKTNQTGNEIRTISTHVLDTSVGQAAANVPIKIYRLDEHENWCQLNSDVTNSDGRAAQLLTATQYVPGTYKLHFDVRYYFEARGVKSIYPFIEIVVECQANQHYHIPLLLNPFGYSTYRGT